MEIIKNLTCTKCKKIGIGIKVPNKHGTFNSTKKSDFSCDITKPYRHGFDVWCKECVNNHKNN